MTGLGSIGLLCSVPHAINLSCWLPRIPWAGNLFHCLFAVCATLDFVLNHFFTDILWFVGEELENVPLSLFSSFESLVVLNFQHSTNITYQMLTPDYPYY